MNYSHYQTKIFDFIRDTRKNGTIEGVAGCGKTTTLVHGLNFTDPLDRVAYAAFNRHTADELKQRVSNNFHVSTFHSLGYGNIRQAFGNVKVEPNKVRNIIKDMAHESDFDTAQILRSHERAIIRTVSLCKATLKDPTPKNCQMISDRYNIDIDEDEKLTIYHAIGWAFTQSVEMTEIIDYDDMIYFSATKMVGCRKFDMLFVDECQDLNASQIQMALLSANRIVSVGDRWQSIYGFRGADINAIPNLIEATEATTLPLNISYRCPKSHIALAQKIVPHIEAADDAQEGIVDNVKRHELVEKVGTGDLVLCRTNAPLVLPAFELIRNGIKAVILGRDIGKGIKALLRKIQKRSKCTSLDTLLARLRADVQQKISAFFKAGKYMRATSEEDKMLTIEALANGCYTISDLYNRIDSVFSDECAAVTFSTIHKAKGKEADRVFILKPGTMPHPAAQGGWQLQQEQNIRYVALTRSKRELYFVR